MTRLLTFFSFLLFFPLSLALPSAIRPYRHQKAGSEEEELKGQELFRRGGGECDASVKFVGIFPCESPAFEHMPSLIGAHLE